jgi:acetylornithine deacetylase
MDFGGGSAPSPLVTLARVSAALAAAEPERGAPIYQYLLRSGEELPWGTEEGTPTAGALEFWAEILPGTTRAQLDAELRGIVGPAAAGGTPLHWEQRTRFLDALAGDPQAPIVQAMRAALPGSPAPTGAPFACDAFIFSEHSTTPVVVCGPGGDNPHAPDEHVIVDDLHTLSSAYVRLIAAWCGRPAQGGGA